MARKSPSSDHQKQLANERRAAEQEARLAERQRKQDERAHREAYVKGRVEAAATETSATERRVQELRNLLSSALAETVLGVDFNALKKPAPTISLDLGGDTDPVPPPNWEHFAPRPPRVLSQILGGKERYTRKLELAEQTFAQAVERHRAAETARQQRVAAARRLQAQQQAKANAAAAAQHAQIELFASAVRAGNRHAASRFFQEILDQVSDAKGFPAERRVGFVPESSLLAIEWVLPGVDVIPTKKAFRYIKARDSIEGTPRPPSEVRSLYQQVVAQLALRALHTVFSADRFNLVSTVVFNGIVRATDPSTGRKISPCLITLRATKDHFAPLVLRSVDPIACVRKHFAADVSPHPEELQAVQPVMSFEMADPRIVDPVDIISDLDKRPNLLELEHKEFEHFVHNLFTRMGLDTKLFRADGDGGVDCVAYDPTPVFGGKYVIQAKLYTKTVPPTAVRDLFGTMQHEGATKGILITTSGFGPTSYEFANGKPLQLIDGSGLLALCNNYNIPARIVPGQRKRSS
ncbi:restriction endonuclease [Micromonospora zamorensis]|uniref:restriction endonuclease n=1 Tax=Micromonospora zamorensis TaxID=709883 RepID=UPI0033F1E40B